MRISGFQVGLNYHQVVKLSGLLYSYLEQNTIISRLMMLFLIELQKYDAVVPSNLVQS